jgi:hypothetical protein
MGFLKEKTQQKTGLGENEKLETKRNIEESIQHAIEWGKATGS